VGSSSPAVFTITNFDLIPVTIDEVSLQQSGSDFSITSNPSGTVLGQHQSADVEVTFSPSAIGVVEAMLIVGWVNAGSGTTSVEITGAGVGASGEPTIEDVLTFFDAAVDDGSLIGTGPVGSSAEAHINAMRHMLLLTAKLISDGLSDVACQQLDFVYDRCDGESPPPDFVKDGEGGGEVVAVLNTMILDLMINLGCY